MAAFGAAGTAEHYMRKNKKLISIAQKDPKFLSRLQQRRKFGNPTLSEFSKPYAKGKAALRTQLYGGQDPTPHEANARESLIYRQTPGFENAVIPEYIRPKQVLKHTKYFNPISSGGVKVGDISGVINRIRQLIAPGGSKGTIYVPASQNARLKRVSQASELKFAIAEVLDVKVSDLKAMPLFAGLTAFADIFNTSPPGFRMRVRTNFADQLKDARRISSQFHSVATKMTGKKAGTPEHAEAVARLTEVFNEDTSKKPWLYKIAAKWHPSEVNVHSGGNAPRHATYLYTTKKHTKGGTKPVRSKQSRAQRQFNASRAQRSQQAKREAPFIPRFRGIKQEYTMPTDYPTMESRYSQQELDRMRMENYDNFDDEGLYDEVSVMPSNKRPRDDGQYSAQMNDDDDQ